MTAAEAPFAFRLILAIELNLVRAPTVEAIPIPRTLIPIMASARTNAAAFFRVLRLWKLKVFGRSARGLPPKMNDAKSCIFRIALGKIGAMMTNLRGEGKENFMVRRTNYGNYSRGRESIRTSLGTCTI